MDMKTRHKEKSTYKRILSIKINKLRKIQIQLPLNLRDILDMIRLNADVPDDFEEYCAIRLVDATDEKNRIDYFDDLWRANRFKKFITQEEIRSIPFLPS